MGRIEVLYCLLSQDSLNEVFEITPGLLKDQYIKKAIFFPIVLGYFLPGLLEYWKNPRFTDLEGPMDQGYLVG